MVIIVTVANESNSDYCYHGSDRYFLSQGRTVESASKNMYNFLKRKFKYFEYETYKTDVSHVIHTQFSKQWCEGECWADLFPSFILPKSNKAGIVEIPNDLFNLLIEYV